LGLKDANLLNLVEFKHDPEAFCKASDLWERGHHASAKFPRQTICSDIFIALHLWSNATHQSVSGLSVLGRGSQLQYRLVTGQEGM
jgi:hypothetical protein